MIGKMLALCDDTIRSAATCAGVCSVRSITRADLQTSMAALKELISGPELRGALDELRAASAELREATARFGTKSDALVVHAADWR
jgi:hypothetical protein